MSRSHLVPRPRRLSSCVAPVMASSSSSTTTAAATQHAAAAATTIKGISTSASAALGAAAALGGGTPERPGTANGGTSDPPPPVSYHGFGRRHHRRSPSEGMVKLSDAQRSYILAPAMTAAAASASAHPMVPSWPTRKAVKDPAQDKQPQPHQASNDHAVPPTATRPSASTTPLSEEHRLNAQHFAYKRACGGHLVHPATEGRLPSINKIIDVGCGTGIWLRDLYASGLLPEGAQLHASEINVEVAAAGIKAAAAAADGGPEVVLFEHDMLEPFEQGQRAIGHKEQVTMQPGTYDLVHARLLVYALDRDNGWQRAVDNMISLLKPGGILCLADLNCYAMSAGSSSSSPAVETLNLIAAKATSFLNKDALAGDHLASRLSHSGLTNVRTQRYHIPFGRALHSHPQRPATTSTARTDPTSTTSTTSPSLEEIDLATATALGAIRALELPLLASGGLVSRGIVTSQDFARWVGELQREIDEKGMYFCFTMACGEKPQTAGGHGGEGEGKNKNGAAAEAALGEGVAKVVGRGGRRLRRRW